MREKLRLGWGIKSRKKNLSQAKRVHMNEYKSQDSKIMYYAFKPKPPISGTKLSFGTYNHPVRQINHFNHVCLFFPTRMEAPWSRNGNYVLLVLSTHQALCHAGKLPHCVKELLSI